MEISKKLRKYTPEQVEWMATNITKFNYWVEFQTEFNSFFGESKSADTLKKFVYNTLKIKPNYKHSGRFIRGISTTTLPLGTIRTDSHGATYIKVAEVPTSTYTKGYERPYWIPLKEKVWIEHYGDIPNGKIITFLNKDTNDYSIDNLACVDRNIMGQLSLNKWYFEDPQLTLIAIRYVELNNLIIQFKRKGLKR